MEIRTLAHREKMFKAAVLVWSWIEKFDFKLRSRRKNLFCVRKEKLQVIWLIFRACKRREIVLYSYNLMRLQYSGSFHFKNFTTRRNVIFLAVCGEKKQLFMYVTFNVLLIKKLTSHEIGFVIKCYRAPKFEINFFFPMIRSSLILQHHNALNIKTT